MKRRLLGLILFVVLTATTACGAQSDLESPDPIVTTSTDRYATPETRRIVESMIAAHGGMERWESAPTMSYTHTFVDPGYPDDPWVSQEVIEQGRRRLYQDWPDDDAQLAFDGERVWTVNWGRDNPPGMMAHSAYFFSNLPWITQDDGVRLGAPERGPFLYESDKEYHIIRMTYDPSTGASPEEYFDLFIDPETYVLRGVNYTVTYRPLLDAFGLPPDVKFIGPLFKVFKTYTTVKGLMLPTHIDTVKDGEV